MIRARARFPARLIVPLVAVLALLAPRATLAQEEPMPPFGRAGEIILDDLAGGHFGAPGYLGQLGGHGAIEGALEDNPLGNTPPPAGFAGLAGYEHHELDGGASNPVTITQQIFWIAPAVDVFVVRRLSIGVAAGLLVENASFGGPGVIPGYTSSAFTISVVPRVGYVIRIAPRFALWPRFGAGYSRGELRGHVPATGTSLPAVTEMALAGVDLGIVCRVTPWLFLHVSPALEAAYSTAVNSNGLFKDFAVRSGGTATVGVSL